MQTQTTFTGTQQIEIKNTKGETLFRLPRPIDVYDAIMGKIELELVSTNIPKLAELYKNETEEEKKLRNARYDRAYKEYEKQFELFQIKMTTLAKDFRKQSFKAAEGKSLKSEQLALQDLESQFT